MRHGGNVWEGQPADWLDFSANLRPEGTPAWVMDTMRAALSQAEIVQHENPAFTMKAIKNETELANLRLAHLRDGAAVTRLMY